MLYEDIEGMRQMMDDSQSLRMKLYLRASQTYEAFEQYNKALSILKQMRDANLLFNKMHIDIRKLEGQCDKDDNYKFEDFSIYKNKKNLDIWVNPRGMSNIQNVVQNAKDIADNLSNDTSKIENESPKKIPIQNDTSAIITQPTPSTSTTSTSASNEPNSVASSPVKSTKTKPVPKAPLAQLSLLEKLEYSKELGNYWYGLDEFDECVMS